MKSVTTNNGNRVAPWVARKTECPEASVIRNKLLMISLAADGVDETSWKSPSTREAIAQRYSQLLPLLQETLELMSEVVAKPAAA